MNEYISREFMLRNLEADKTNNAEHCEPVTVKIMERFIRYVKEFPSADVQPVKRGRWIISNLYAQCSECSVAYDLDTFQRLIPMNKNVPRHCSYCGARMGGDTE